jgi:D-lactate dehydrogenase (cytochrome)
LSTLSADERPGRNDSFLEESESIEMTTLTEATRTLREALGEDRVRDGDSERDLHAGDLSFHAPRRPDLVVYPGSTGEVARVLTIANELRIPVTPFGVGTSLEGHVIPVRGGISLDLSRLDRILDVSPENLTATVQAGVTRLTLERAAGQHGLFFPVDPGADATLGGMAATNAAGTTTVRYGKMRANVLALEAVLADGRVIRTGSRAAKTSAGYDLTGLLVGSEGTLAVITEVTVRLHAIPEHVVALRIAFPDIESACRTAAGIVGAGAGVTRIELLDAWIVSAVNAYSGTSYPEGPCLFVEATGSEEVVVGDLELVQAIARGEGATDVVHERDPDARARLWKARHDAAHAAAAKMPGTKERTTDVCVPLTALAGSVRFTRAEIDRLGLHAGIVGHAGDGNVHVAIQVDLDDPDEVSRSDELVHNVVDDALARGGTCTGEHGIGLGKIGALEQEHGDLIPLMVAIKASFDPNGILNPGKVLPESGDASVDAETTAALRAGEQPGPQ